MNLSLLPLHFFAGVVAGVVFFRALRWGARLLVEGGPVSTVFALTLGRFLLVGALLFLAARQGAGPLMAASVGIFVGRFFVMRAAP
jgi:F1F0 ATPase subunit 2